MPFDEFDGSRVSAPTCHAVIFFFNERFYTNFFLRVSLLTEALEMLEVTPHRGLSHPVLTNKMLGWI